ETASPGRRSRAMPGPTVPRTPRPSLRKKRGHMTGIDENARGGRFGAATPGARPRQGPSEASFTALGNQDGRQRARRRLAVTIVGALALAGAGYAAGPVLPPGPPPPRPAPPAGASKG